MLFSEETREIAMHGVSQLLNCVSPGFFMPTSEHFRAILHVLASALATPEGAPAQTSQELKINAISALSALLNKCTRGFADKSGLDQQYNLKPPLCEKANESLLVCLVCALVEMTSNSTYNR